MQSRQKIRIKRKKIVIPVRKRSKRDRLYAFLKKNSRKLLIVFTFLGLVGILTYEWSHQKTDTPTTTNFPYPEILPKKMLQRNCTLEFVKHTTLRDFFEGKIVDNDIRNEVVYQANNDHNVSVIDEHDGFYIFLIDEKDKLSADFFVYQMAVDSFLTINLFPSVQIDMKTVALTTKLKKISGKVNRSLAGTIAKQSGILHEKITEKESTEFQTILNTQSVFDVADVKINDEFDLVYEEKWHKDTEVSAGNILAVHYRRDGKAFYAFRYENGDGTIFFDENGNISKKRFLPYPLQHNIVTSHYGPREHPIDGKNHVHHGTDYRANKGDPVYTVGDGVVTKADSTKNNGNNVRIQHDSGYTTQYLHFSSIAEGIKIGAKVKQGDIIGRAGDTGKADGVHVCFRVKKNNKPIDHTKDSTFRKSKTFKVQDLNGFKQHRDSLLLMLKK